MEPVPVSNETIQPTAAPPRVPRGTVIFCLVLVGCGLLVVTVRRLLNPSEPKAVQMQTYDLADEAKKLVRKEKPAPLSGPLQEILDEGKRVHFETQQHPLLGKAAPEFSRTD